MPSSKALSSRQNDIAREVLRVLLRDRFEGDQTVAANALGVSQPTLSNFLSGERGTGPKMLAGIAKVDPAAAASILAGVAVPAAGGPKSPQIAPGSERVVELDALDVSRQDAAIEVLVRRGVGLRAAERAIAGVREFKHDEALEPEVWADLAQALVLADEKRKMVGVAPAAAHPKVPPKVGRGKR